MKVSYCFQIEYNFIFAIIITHFPFLVLSQGIEAETCLGFGTALVPCMAFLLYSNPRKAAGSLGL